MELLNKLTIKNLKLNKKRTIVTIIGIILSVALLTAVTSMFFSFRASLIKFEKERNGNYHWGFRDVPAQNISEFTQNRKIETVNIVQELGYDYLNGSQNEYKPYINVKAYTKTSMQNLGISILEGRLPQNENEIIISVHTETNGGIAFNLGEKITLNIGTRVSDGHELNQYNPYNPEEKEEIIRTKEQTYTIVGIIERPDYKIEPHSAPGYTFITYLDEKNIKSDESVNIYARYTKEGIRDYLKVTANILNVNEEAFIKLNGPEGERLSEQEREKLRSELGQTRYDADSHSYLITIESGIIKDGTMRALGTAVLVVFIIIIFTSVFCIKNSFDISISEKTKQYGMLSSVGATRKQIKRNVYYEVLILGLIGTPIGILCGEIAAYILIIVSNTMLKEALNIELIFSFSWIAIIFASILAFITIYLSARKSAKRASKITPIIAIRNSEEIKIKAKKIKSPKIIKKIFGIGGEIAHKNLKRSKKKYRTTVISIILCVSVFIAVSSFINLAFDVIKKTYQNTEYNIVVGYHTNENIDSRIEQIYNLDTVKRYSSIDGCTLNFTGGKFTEEYLKLYPEFRDGVYILDDGTEEIVKDAVYIYSVNKEEFSRYVKELGLDYEKVKDKAILINNIFAYKTVDNRAVEVEMSKYTYKVGDKIKGTLDEIMLDSKNHRKECEFEIAKITKEVPFGITEFTGNARLIISEELGNKIIDTDYKNVYIDSTDGTKTQEDISEILKDKTEYTVTNYEEETEMMNSVYTLIAIFLYGFMIVIALIGITNIFNTITTNMSLRKREFAMLQSIGMTKKEFNRMIRLESIFYCSKSLIIGIPIGIALSYLIFKVMMNGSLVMQFPMPIGAIIISIIAVLLLIWTIMRYSISKINKQNIIDTIRNDNI